MRITLNYGSTSQPKDMGKSECLYLCIWGFYQFIHFISNVLVTMGTKKSFTGMFSYVIVSS